MAVAACHPTAPVAPPVAPPMSPLVGTWGLEAEPCAGDNGLAFGSDGNWSAYRTGGNWHLDGATLTLVTTRIENENGATIAVSHPETQRQRISFPAADRLVMMAADGTTKRLKRCH